MSVTAYLVQSVQELHSVHTSKAKRSSNAFLQICRTCKRHEANISAGLLRTRMRYGPCDQKRGRRLGRACSSADRGLIHLSRAILRHCLGEEAQRLKILTEANVQTPSGVAQSRTACLLTDLYNVGVLVGDKHEDERLYWLVHVPHLESFP